MRCHSTEKQPTVKYGNTSRGSVSRSRQQPPVNLRTDSLIYSQSRPEMILGVWISTNPKSVSVSRNSLQTPASTRNIAWLVTVRRSRMRLSNRVSTFTLANSYRQHDEISYATFSFQLNMPCGSAHMRPCSSYGGLYLSYGPPDTPAKIQKNLSNPK